MRQQRDVRWANVRASIGDPEISGEDLETGYYKVLEKNLEVLIEVPHNGMVYYSKVYADKEAFEPFYGFDLMRMVLDKMVEQIDDAMEEG